MYSLNKDIKRVVFGVTLLALFHSGVSQAGVIRHDRSDALYTSLAAQTRYSGVGDMIINNNTRCSGTAINSSWVLTAAHCVDGGPASINFSVGGNTYAGVEAIVHENWTANLAAGFDIALVRTGNAMTGVTFANLYMGGAELGNVGTNVGFGVTGDGQTGFVSPSGTKRAGNNMVDVLASAFGWSSNILMQDFDSPLDPAESQFGASTPLDLEYLIAPGDSGGGLFLNIGGVDYLAGVHSFLAWNDGTGNADYGDMAGSTRVSAYIDWIDGHINPQPVPESGTLALMAFGTALLGFGRRRKQKM